MRFSRGNISKYNLNLKKLKTCHPEENNKDDASKKIYLTIYCMISKNSYIEVSLKS